MQKMIGMLGALLVIQLTLAVGLSFSGPDLTAHRPDTPFIDLDGHSVDRLTIEGPDEQHIVLARQGEGWVLPGTGGFPADKSKINHLLEQLTGLKRGLAIATTAGAQQRFKVSAEDFERRVLLGEGDETLATLYFGTSPGMRRVHARSGADTAVYTAEFGIYEAPLKPEDWEDKEVLKIPPGDIESIDLDKLALSRVPGTPEGGAAEDSEQQTGEKTHWTSTGLSEGETVNQANADTLADKLAGLRIGAVLGSEKRPEYGLDEPELMFRVQRKDGTDLEYRIGKRDKDNDYVLKVSSRPEYFRLPGYTVEALVKAAGRNQLVRMDTTAVDKDETAHGPKQSPSPGGADEPDSAPPHEDAG